jgi:hypothetical protein
VREGKRLGEKGHNEFLGRRAMAFITGEGERVKRVRVEMRR